MDDNLRVERRSPFGIQRPGRLIISTLVIGVVMLAVGIVAVKPLAILGICVLLTAPFLLLAFANVWSQPTAFTLRAEGLAVERRGTETVLPWAEIRGATVTQIRGKPAFLGVQLAGSLQSFNVAAFDNARLAQLVAGILRRAG